MTRNPHRRPLQVTATSSAVPRQRGLHHRSAGRRTHPRRHRAPRAGDLHIFNTHEHVDHIAVNAPSRRHRAILVVHEDGAIRSSTPSVWASMTAGRALGLMGLWPRATPGGRHADHPRPAHRTQSRRRLPRRQQRALHWGHALRGQRRPHRSPGGDTKTLRRSLKRLVEQFEPDTRSTQPPRTLRSLRAAEQPFLRGL